MDAEGAEEIRCPKDRRKMFAKVSLGDDVTIMPGNVIEVACPHCKAEERKAGRECDLVLHRYNLVGEHIETVRL